MERVRFIEHDGKKILHLDLSFLKAEKVMPVIEQARATIASQPFKSVFTLTDVTGANFNDEVAQALKAFVAHNKPYVVAAAVVGVTGFKQVLFNTAMLFSGRTLHAFGSFAEAKTWLASQQPGSGPG